MPAAACCPRREPGADRGGGALGVHGGRDADSRARPLPPTHGAAGVGTAPRGLGAQWCQGSVGTQETVFSQGCCLAPGDASSQGQQGTAPGGKRVGPGDRATAAPVAPVALFPGTDGGGDTLTTAIKAPDGGGLAWGRPMRGPLGLQGPEPHSPHTLAQAEQQEWRGCCRLSQGSDVGLCRAPPEGQWHSRRTAGGWPAPRAGRRPGRAGGQCGEAPALTPVREVE